jgi:indole-3-glycerol phosphate synthase
VNSRNLKTLKTDLAVARDLVAAIPDGSLCIAESGIRSATDLRDLGSLGYDGFLIGESLLREKSPGAALERLIVEAG